MLILLFPFRCREWLTCGEALCSVLAELIRSWEQQCQINVSCLLYFTFLLFLLRQLIDSSAPDPVTYSKLFWDCWSVCRLLPRHAEAHGSHSRLTRDLGYEDSKRNYYSHNPIEMDLNKWLVFEMKNTVVTTLSFFLVFFYICLFVWS